MHALYYNAFDPAGKLQARHFSGLIGLGIQSGQNLCRNESYGVTDNVGVVWGTLAHDFQIGADQAPSLDHKLLISWQLAQQVRTVPRVWEGFLLFVFIKEMAEREGFESSVLLCISIAYKGTVSRSCLTGRKQ